MTAAERILLEAEADAAEAKARRIRQHLGAKTGVTAQARRHAVRPPSPEDMTRAGKVTSLPNRRLTAALERQGVVPRSAS